MPVPLSLANSVPHWWPRAMTLSSAPQLNFTAPPSTQAGAAPGALGEGSSGASSVLPQGPRHQAARVFPPWLHLLLPSLTASLNAFPITLTHTQAPGVLGSGDNFVRCFTVTATSLMGPEKENKTQSSIPSETCCPIRT